MQYHRAGPHRPAFVFVVVLTQSCKSKATQFCQGWLLLFLIANRNPWIEPAEINVTSGVNDVDLVIAPEAGKWGKLQVWATAAK